MKRLCERDGKKYVTLRKEGGEREDVRGEKKINDYKKEGFAED